MESKHAPLVVLVLAGFLGACVSPPPPPDNTKRRDGGSSGARDLSGSTTCGGVTEPCCTDSDDPCDSNNGLACDDNTGGCYGVAGYACDTGDECGSGLSCTQGVCCSGISSSCQDTGDCCAGLLCTDGTCDNPSGDCGEEGQACCTPPSDECVSGTTCQGGECVSCGHPGEPCCDVAPLCLIGTSCMGGTCESSCGATGGPCCEGATLCTDPAASCVDGLCADEGGEGTLGNPCRPGNDCDDPLVCLSGICKQPASCNTVGATCCAGGTCNDPGLQCAENNTCQPAPMCSPLRDSCSSASECCAGLGCKPSPTSPICCVAKSGSCPGGNLDCCGQMLCVSGKCACQADGLSCVDNADCCNGDCDSSTSTCRVPPMMCMGQDLGEPCTSNDQCCGTQPVCAILASTMALTCCLAAYDACNTSADCCGRAICHSTMKFCVARTQGQTCLTNWECDPDANLDCVMGTCQPR